MVDPLSYFSFQPVLHDWCNKGRGICYPACGTVYIKEPLLLIGKSNPCGGSGFPLSRYLNGSLPYVRRHITVNKCFNVLSASLNKALPSFLYFQDDNELNKTAIATEEWERQYLQTIIFLKLKNK